jgi:hypothetical protein
VIVSASANQGDSNKFGSDEPSATDSNRVLNTEDKLVTIFSGFLSLGVFILLLPYQFSEV